MVALIHKFMILIPECGMTDDENIVIIQDCQVQASSQYDDDHDPYFAINDPDITQEKKGNLFLNLLYSSFNFLKTYYFFVFNGRLSTFPTFL